MAWALHRLGVSLLVQVEAGQIDPQSAEIVVREGLGIWRDLDERRHLAFSTIDLGVTAGLRGDFEQARFCFHESLFTFSELDDDEHALPLVDERRRLADLGGAERSADTGMSAADQ